MRILPALFVALTCCPCLRSQTVGIEDFTYANGSIANKSGGTGFNYDNFDGQTTLFKSDWDADFGATVVTSHALVTQDSAAKREYNGDLEGDGGADGSNRHERSGAVRGDGQVFYRFKMTRAAGDDWCGASSYDFGAERLFFGVPWPGAATDRIGIQVLNTDAAELPAGQLAMGLATLNDNTAYTLVAVVDFTNNLLGLFVNPGAGDFWNPANGSHTADVTLPYLGANWSTAVRLGSGAVPVTWDDLTVALDPSGVGLSNGQQDLDGDGLPGVWEAAHGLSDSDNGSTDPDNGSAGDPDDDGLNNAGELAANTDPQDSDSDNDDHFDGAEVAAASDPKDPASYPGSHPDPHLTGVEHFDDADGPVDGRAGGTHWDFDNSIVNDPFVGHTDASSRWSATDGSPEVSDGVLVTRNSGARREYHGASEGGPENWQEIGGLGDDLQFSRRVIYYRFSMTRRAGATWGGASSFDFANERYLFGVPDAANPSSGQREFAIHDLITDTHAYSGIQPVAGQSYTVVAKLDFDGDVAALYLDPDLSQSEAANLPVATYPHPSGNWSTAIRFASGGTGDVEWDHVRLATAWADLKEPAPVANDDSLTMHHATKARIAVLANDSGSLDPASLVIVTPPVSGTATVSPDGTILYEHIAGMPAGDAFSYRVKNATGEQNDVATVTVNFTAAARFTSDFVNLPPAPPATALRIDDAFPGLTFQAPHGFCSVPGGPPRLLVTEGDGRVFMLSDLTAVTPVKTQILDIASQVPHDQNEIAMKGIAAHPQWSSNGYIYVTYNATGNKARLSRFTCQTSPPYTAGSELVLIDQLNEGDYHNIATCEFGADGYLYVGFGDEGTQEDGFGNSQHIDGDLWSCVIRIDVDKSPANLIPNPDSDIPRVGGGTSGEANFRVPVDNPFVGATTFNGVAIDPASVRTEIFVTGQRNPWQLSPEDRDGNGTVDELWIGDVGRTGREEVGVYAAGQNGGWAWREGTAAGVRSGQLINGASEAAANAVAPRWDYQHGGGALEGTCVIGGFIYRGSGLPGLTGKYVFADYASGNIWSLSPDGPPVVERLGGEVAIVGLLEDPATGGILLLDRGNNGTTPGLGSIQRLTLGTNDTSFPQTLSQTNFFADLSSLAPNPGGVAYEPNLRFWSDHAEKSRWFLIRNTTDTVDYSKDGPWSYPEGMVWVKHFDYPTQWESFTRTIDGTPVADRRPAAGSPRRRVETRFLVRTAAGAYGVSYRWENLNAGIQGDAVLVDNNGESFDIGITLDGNPATAPWLIPSRSSCLTCHTPEAGHALSFNTRQLNATGSLAGSSGNFLTLLAATGYLDGLSESPSTLPRHLRPDESTYSLEARVRSYLDVNCAYCHRSGGTGGGNWDGRSHLKLAQTGLINGTTVDAPLHPGDLLVVPGDVDRSILYNRAAAANGYTRMPPLATSVTDLEGAQLLADWIASEVQPYATYDAWRISRFGNNTSPQGAPGANPDGDAATNELEWLANTDPNSAASLWKPVLRVNGNTAAFDLPGLGNRSVTIFRSGDLENWSRWQVPGNDGIPLDPANLHTFEGPKTAKEFFRFGVEER